MLFQHPRMVAAIESACDATKAHERAHGHNFRHEERLSGERVAAYEVTPYLPETPDLDGLADGYQSYRKTRILVNAGDIAETFTAINSAAFLPVVPEPSQSLVRVESIGWALGDGGSGIGFDEMPSGS